MKLGRYDRIDIHTDLGIAQHLDRIAVFFHDIGQAGHFEMSPLILFFGKK
jgi:hypothetical protein